MKTVKVTIYSTDSWLDMFLALFIGIPFRHIIIKDGSLERSFGDDKEGLNKRKDFNFLIDEENLVFEQVPSHVSAMRLCQIMLEEIEEMHHYGAEIPPLENLKLEYELHDIVGT